jgi:beta-glucosidase-like glycosyl hydrolase
MHVVMHYKRDRSIITMHASCTAAGSVLSGGGSIPAPNAAPAEWVKMVNEIQRGAMSSRLGIPMLYGIDAVHGHNNVYRATIFPHNIGLGCTRCVTTSLLTKT